MRPVEPSGQPKFHTSHLPVFDWDLAIGYFIVQYIYIYIYTVLTRRYKAWHL